MLKKIFLSLLILFFTVNILAQKTKAKSQKQKSPSSVNFRFGNLKELKVAYVDFKSQSEIIVAEPLKFVSCIVYFAGAGFPSVQSVTLSENLSAMLTASIIKCMPGSSIYFTNIKVKGPDGISTIDDVTYLLY